MKETYQGIQYDCDEVYSNKDHTGHDLSDRKDISGIVIHGLCLSNETPNARVLPLDITGTTFLCCNLDNVFIPDGNTLINCSNRLFQAQEDGHDWIVEAVVQQTPQAGKMQLGGDTLDAGTQQTTYTAVQPLNPVGS